MKYVDHSQIYNCKQWLAVKISLTSYNVSWMSQMALLYHFMQQYSTVSWSST